MSASRSKQTVAESLQREPALRVVIPTLEGGGSERVCLRLCNSWAEAGVPVELLLVRSRGTYLSALDPGVTCINLNAASVKGSVGSLRRAVNRWPGVPVLVFGFDLGVVAGLLQRLRLLHAPVIFREGSAPLMNIPGSWRPLYRLAISGADGFVAQTRHTAEVLGQLGLRGRPLAVIPNPAVGSYTQARSRSVGNREAFPRLLAVGRLSQEKGFDVLLRGFAGLLSLQPSATLNIVGEGPERDSLSRLATELMVKSRVTMPGFVSDVQACYENTDLFVLSSRYEGQPNALLEAILSGCPVVATGGEAVREILGDVGLEDSYLAPGEFERALALKIMALLAKPPEFWMVAAARLSEMVAPATVARRYLDFCRQFEIQSNRR